MSVPTPKIDHIERLGLRVCTTLVAKTLSVLGRRSRKVWACTSGDACEVGQDINVEDLYIEHAVGISRFTGTVYRYHVPCAISKGLVETNEKSANKANDRRMAILTQQAKSRVNAN